MKFKHISELIANILFICLCIIFSFSFSHAQNIDSTKAYSDKKNPSLFEIHEIQFSGNNNFTYDELITAISSRASNRSFTHKIFDDLDEKLFSNKQLRKILPKQLMQGFYSVVNSMSNEIRYFSDYVASQDTLSLKNFYNQNGFHNAKIRYIFGADTLKKINVLKFIIEENQRSILNEYYIYGLDSLPNDVASLIAPLLNFPKGNYFNESSIIEKISKINLTLQENGYYNSRFSIPVLTGSIIDLKDTLSVYFEKGKRMKIGTINYLDSLKGQSIIVSELKDRQLEFQVGDWFNISNISKSESNLRSLGCFDYVSIDTSSQFKLQTDTSLSFVVFTQYTKQQDYGVSFYLNRTAIDNYLNLGIEASYSHRNVFQAAQTISPYLRFVVQDFSRFLYDISKFEYEIQAGINYYQPLLETIDKAKIGLSFQFQYSLRTISREFLISTFSLPIKAPIRFPTWTYFNSATLSLTFENQYPIDYLSARENALRNAKNHYDTLKVYEALYIYDNLYNFNEKYHPILTGNLLGITIQGDTRDNPFSPTKGYFTALSIDGFNFILYPIDLAIQAIGTENKLLGNAKFARLQLTNYWFWQLSPQSVLALKQREGVIFWWDRKNYSYIPYDKQFFCGGANSVRGWPSRQLRFVKGISYFDKTYKQLDDFATDYVGNGILIEGSLEWRYKFGLPGKNYGAFSGIISNLGITTFLDWGNAFQWLLLDENSDYIVTNLWYEFITGLAISAGFGLRFELPVGPIRFDLAWPIYDPSAQTDKTIFSRPGALTNFQFHIGLGHAF